VTYRPKPLDTSAVTLPASLRNLLEKLAENTHEVWAVQRISDGWTLGPNRDDDNKKHPGLVPYADLSEGEKEYDRKTASETLKAILLLGYAIEEPNERTTRPTP
jgi:RyR domain-containing protein